MGAAGEDIPVTEMYIPAKYNTETTLTAVVLDDDLNEFEFALKSE